jgi:hypothetical protein
MALKEMMSKEQDNAESQSTVKVRGQDIPDAPPSKSELEDKMAAYESIYTNRRRNDPASKALRKQQTAVPKKAPSSTKQNVEKLIASKGYDKAEAAFMRDNLTRNND